jgi:hypothetical protein
LESPFEWGIELPDSISHVVRVKATEKRPFGRPRRRWEDIKMDVKK